MPRDSHAGPATRPWGSGGSIAKSSHIAAAPVSKSWTPDGHPRERRTTAVLTFPWRGAVTSFSQRIERAIEEAAWPATTKPNRPTSGRRFIKTAVEILRETGRTDFTVQEVVARSKTSLRAFYQHFSSKDELLIALLERTMAQSTQVWRAETTGLDSTAAIKLIIDRISAEPESSTQDSLTGR